MSTQEMEKLTYNTDEVAALLGVSRFTIYTMVQKKQIRPLAVQKRPYVFPKTEVARVMKDMVGSEFYKED